MQKRALVGWHWLEAQPFLGLICSEDPKQSFLRLRPLGILTKQFQGLIGVWYVVVFMGLRVDIEGQSQLPIPFQARALTVAIQHLLKISIAGL
jgi:hypothetical protein